MLRARFCSIQTVKKGTEKRTPIMRTATILALLALLLAFPVAAQTKNESSIPPDVKAAIIAKCEKRSPDSYMDQANCISVELDGWVRVQRSKN